MKVGNSYIEILEEACQKSGIFSAGLLPILCCKERFLLSPVKMILCSKLHGLGWRSADFLKDLLPKMFAGSAQTYSF
jgi:hypothetical protein